MQLIYDPDEMNLPSAGARYKQIARVLSQNIANGNLAPNTQIPPEPQLMELFGCSRITIRAAIKELVDKGQLVRRQGLGTFVTEELKNLSVNDCSGFTDSCIMDGHKPLTKVVLFKKTPVDTKEIADFLSIKPGDMAYRVDRIRYIDDQPCVYEISYVSEKYKDLFIAGQEEWEKSLYKLIEKTYGNIRIEGKRYYDCGKPTPEIQASLRLDDDNNILVLEDLHWDSNNNPIFSSTMYYKPSVFRFYSTFISLL